MNARRRLVVLARTLLAMALSIGMLHGSVRPAAAASQIDIPGPAGSGAFGETVTVLPNGNIVVTDPNYNGGIGVNAGAAYLYNGATGAQISMLTGMTAGDQVGSVGVTVLSNGNYVVRSMHWHNGAAADAGAVTWGSAASGVSGAVSAANSLVGSTANDRVGASGVTALSDGDYVVRSPVWDNGGLVNAGAVTWGNGATGISGLVSPANSLVGGAADNQVGYDGVTALSNGNYVVRSHYWDNGAVANAGAITWGDGNGGTVGAVSEANSLVGSTANDYIGSWALTLLSDDDYVAPSPEWDNGAAVDAGAVTWGNGNSGIAGPISAANSLVGNKTNDQVGYGGVTALSNGNYVAISPYWTNGAASGAGAVTWGDGDGGTTGLVSAGNSLVGSVLGDTVGNHGVTALSNGNYVVRSPLWDDGGTVNAGAATWGDGNGGLSGLVSAANSLVGGTASDQVGFYVDALSNGNYVVCSYLWDDGAVVDAGAATWGNGDGGISGPVTPANSLVGGTAGDHVGLMYVNALSNGNYLVRSPHWDNGAAANAGAVTWANGSSGIAGPVTPANSLVGSTADDGIGNNGETELSDGDYVVLSPYWDNGALVNAGAATWGSRTGGISGEISALNSLVGSTPNDQVGHRVAALSDGGYVVRSQYWDDGALVNAGAVAWGSGDGGTVGLLTPANSLVGSTAEDRVGSQEGLALEDGSYVVYSPLWDNGGVVNAGAVSWGFAPAGLSGPIDATTSVRGATAGGGGEVNFEYDPANHQLVVGRPYDNIVTLFRLAFGVTMTPATDAKGGLPGATASYTLQVANTGDTVDSFNLALSAHDWTTALPATVGPIDPGASQDVTVTVSVPASAPGGGTDAVTVTVTSQTDGSKTDTAVLTTTANNVYGVTVTPPTSAKSGAPGSTVSYVLAVQNTGNTPASFNLAASAHDWTTALPAAVGPIAAGASQNVTVGVTVPGSAIGGTTDAVTITVTSQADGSKTDTAVLTTTAGERKIYMPFVDK